MLRNEEITVLRAFARNPQHALSSADLIATTTIEPSLVYRSLFRLEKAGFLFTWLAPGHQFYRLTTSGATLLSVASGYL